MALQSTKYKLKIGTIYSPVLSDSAYTNEMDKVLIFLLLMMGMMVTESFFISRRDLRRSWNLLPRWFYQPKQEDRQDYDGGGEDRDRADDLSSDHSHSGRHSKRFHHHHNKKSHHHCGHSHDHDHHHDDHYKSKYYYDDHYKSKYNDDHYKSKYNDEHYKNRSNEDNKPDEEDYYEDDKRTVQPKRMKNEERPKRREKPRARSSTTASPEDYQDQPQDDGNDGNVQQQPQQQPQQQQYRYANHPAMQYKKDYVAGVLVTIPNIRNGDDLEPYFQRAKYSNPFFQTFLKDGEEYAPEETIARPLYYNFE